MRRVVVTGMGLVSSLGLGTGAAVEAMRDLRSGVTKWDPVPGVALPVKVAGVVPGFDLTSLESSGWRWPERVELEESVLRGMPPHGVPALTALAEALREAGLTRDGCGDGRTGLHTASAGSARLLHGRLGAMEASGWRRAHPLGVVSSVAGALGFHLGAWLGIRGESCGFVSACASSAHALGYAADAIRLGRQDRMIVVGAEDLSAESVLPFHGMGVLSVEDTAAAAVRPFDVRRNGFAATGGAAVMVLEDESTALRRGAEPIAVLAGWGQAGDGWHPAAPHPEGRGLEQAMRLALADSGVTVEEIGHVNAHGTGTVAGDAAEALALRRVLGGSGEAAVASTKALTGHGLSLAGAMEAVLSVLALRHGLVPGQAHLEEPLPEGEGLHFPRRSERRPLRAVLNNSCGFGGANVVHVFTHD